MNWRPVLSYKLCTVQSTMVEETGTVDTTNLPRVGPHIMLPRPR